MGKIITVLGWCLKRYDRVDLLSFDYGQNHSIELKASKKIIKAIEKNFKKYLKIRFIKV